VLVLVLHILQELSRVLFDCKCELFFHVGKVIRLNVKSKTLEQLFELLQTEDTLLLCINNKPETEASKLISEQLKSKSPLVGRNDLILVDFHELVISKALRLEASQVTHMRMDHLLQIFGVNRESESELLAKVSMHLSDLVTGNSVSLSILFKIISKQL
jgi:hypothetical protein